MASVGEPLRRSPFPTEPRSYNPPPTRTLPILPSAAAHTPGSGDPMDVSQAQSHSQSQQSQSHPHTTSMGPPLLSPNGERHGDQQHAEQQAAGSSSGQNAAQSQPVGAAAAAQQPKVVQTAFIHKLYNMLEDQSIQHLISWSNTNESFVMSPSSEFSKVLAQYFKHTNISSFVRQLNMYGFHKVSDVFHTGSPDSPLWEFKHGAGNFKRGDLVGLREIKRRASRHALIHRDSFSNAPKMPAPPQPGPPLETMPDPVEARLNIMEWNMQDVYARLARTEEAYSAMTSRCHLLLDGLNRCHHWNHELSTQLLAMVPDLDNPVHRDVYAMRQDISQQMNSLRSLEESQDSPFANKQTFFPPGATLLEPAMPSSPYQRPFDESRRPSLQTIGRPPSFRGAVPAHVQASPRRFGSIGSGAAAFSPSTRPTYQPPPPPAPVQPQPQHPLAKAQSPGLPRRHTSADIRLQGWQGGQPPPSYPQGGQPPPSYPQGSSPYASGHNSTAWPSSPRHAPMHDNQQIRDALAQYELPRASAVNSRQPSPPPAHEMGAPSFSGGFGYANSSDAGWQLPGARYPFKGIDTAPPTRRSSMASNVHNLLNPADTAEREGEDEGPDERKRKRLL